MRVFRGKVVFLSGVEGKVVELDRSVFLFPTPTLELLVLGKDEFPLSAANRLELSGVVIIESLVRGFGSGRPKNEIADVVSIDFSIR